MKVLFLDIDGVLNSARTALAFGGYPMELEHLPAFDQAALGLIRRLCDAADVQIVLSSAWRLHYPHKHVGKALGLPIIDRTPSLSGVRGLEIQRWLADHPEVEEYAIVDDNSDMLPDQERFFVQTDGLEGLTYRDYQKLCHLYGVSAHDGSVRDREWRNAPKLAWED